MQAFPCLRIAADERIRSQLHWLGTLYESEVLLENLQTTFLWSAEAQLRFGFLG